MTEFYVWLKLAESRATIRCGTLRGHLMAVYQNTGTCKVKLNGRHLMCDVTQIDGVWIDEAWQLPALWPLHQGPGTLLPQRSGKRWLQPNAANRVRPSTSALPSS